MPDTKELKQIKNIYGEKFKNLCRDMFPTIIEQEGKLLEILQKKFAYNCNSLYEAITNNNLENEFKELIFREFGENRETNDEIENRTPYEIFDEIGYDLYECKTEAEIQSFRKYYAEGEVLCTIYNGGRLRTRDCFWAVKKNLDNIKRENFKYPQKDDEYSRSVLAIQFTKDKNSTVEIISRYNHTVSNPNCTLNNDLDSIAPGLAKSFNNILKERGREIKDNGSKNIEIPGYMLANDGRYYKYNKEVNGIYYCPNNIIIKDGKPKCVINSQKGILIDCYIIDFENKKITLVDNYFKDSFPDAMPNIEKIEIEKIKNDQIYKIISIHMKDVNKTATIGIDKDCNILKYENENANVVGNYFLYGNNNLIELKMPNLQSAGNYFLSCNDSLKELSLPNLKSVQNYFLSRNNSLQKLDLPKLKSVGDFFLIGNRDTKNIYVPNLHKVGAVFLISNYDTQEKIMQNIKKSKSNISPNDIAVLDKETKLKKSEICEAKEVIEKTVEKSSEKDER